MQGNKQTLDIRLRLDGKVKERFLAIKEAEGLTNKTEVLRLIINEYYQRKHKEQKQGET